MPSASVGANLLVVDPPAAGMFEIAANGDEHLSRTAQRDCPTPLKSTLDNGKRLKITDNHANRRSHRNGHAQPLASAPGGAAYRLAVPLSLGEFDAANRPKRLRSWSCTTNLGAGIGSRIAISEGPRGGPAVSSGDQTVDAYNAAILDQRSNRIVEASDITADPARTWTFKHCNATELMNLHQLKHEICDIGRRIYNKGFAAGNDGNISYRLSRERSALHADDDLQGLHEARRSVHRRHGRQAARRQAETHQRNPAAPGDHEGAAGREERRPLPSAACHGVRRRPRADSAVRAARGRGVPGRRADHASTKRPAARSSPTRSCRSSRRRTSSSWPTTARSASAKRSRRPTGGRKFSTPTAAS